MSLSDPYTHLALLSAVLVVYLFYLMHRVIIRQQEIKDLALLRQLAEVAVLAAMVESTDVNAHNQAQVAKAILFLSIRSYKIQLTNEMADGLIDAALAERQVKP